MPRWRVKRGQTLPGPTLLGTSAQSMVHKDVEELDWTAQHSDLNRTPSG